MCACARVCLVHLVVLGEAYLQVMRNFADGTCVAAPNGFFVASPPQYSFGGRLNKKARRSHSFENIVGDKSRSNLKNRKARVLVKHAGPNILRHDHWRSASWQDRHGAHRQVSVSPFVFGRFCRVAGLLRSKCQKNPADGASVTAPPRRRRTSVLCALARR